MLSNITSGIGGLITSVKGNNKETTEEEVKENPAAVVNKSRSGSTSGGGGAEGGGGGGATSGLMNIRSSLPSWLGGGGGPKEDTPTTEGEESVSSENRDAAAATSGDEEKQVPEEPTSDNNRVKNLGNLLSSGFANLGSTIKQTGQKIKDTAKSSMGGAASPPWVGFEQEEALKEEVLGLSADRRNFVRSPPTGVQFEWNYEETLPIAKAILKEDPALEKMRYELVPKVVSEENFWKNYFYRVMLLKGSLGGTKKQDSIDTDDEDADDPELDKELEKELDGFEVVKSSKKDDDLDLK